MKERNDGYIYYEYHKQTDKEIIRDVAWTSVFRWIYAIIFLFIVLSLIFSVFFRVVAVDGSSMEPTLHDKDIILADAIGYKAEIGDVVLLKMSDEDDVLIVKRIIATEGQTVDIDYNSKTVTVDGKILDEPYISEMLLPINNEMEYPYTVPRGYVFVMGDNRAESVDSRNKNIQAIAEEKIVGDVIARVYPFSDFITFE